MLKYTVYLNTGCFLSNRLHKYHLYKDQILYVQINDVGLNYLPYFNEI